MHSHTSIQFLVKRAEELALKRSKKDRKPAWLNRLINDTADLFEPETEAARVGYQCHFDEQGWQVQFYLGDAEHFGGINDGKRERIAFDFDLKQLLDSFDLVESMRNRILSEQQPASESCTMIEITGQLSDRYEQARLTIGILSRPPQAAGPGVRIHANGNIEAI